MNEDGIVCTPLFPYPYDIVCLSPKTIWRTMASILVPRRD